MDEKYLLWWSAGATSAVAVKLALDEYGIDNCRIIYFGIESAHIDNDRFMKDCEKWYGKKIETFSSDKYVDQFDVVKNTRYVNGVGGARCTKELKRGVREKIEKEIPYKGQVFGYEYVFKEMDRALRMYYQHPHTKPIFPLINNKMTKENCLGVLRDAGIEIPAMYKLGYPNNNCIGCVKGGMGYWNKIRVDFPEHFNKMMELEQEVGRSCLKENGKPLFLKDLHPDRGRGLKMIIPDCGFFCGDDNEYI
jgi:hypothetical protein